MTALLSCHVEQLGQFWIHMEWRKHSLHDMGLEFLTALHMKVAIFWDVTSHTLKMEEAVSSNTCVPVYQTKRHNNSEDSSLHIPSLQNSISYLICRIMRRINKLIIWPNIYTQDVWSWDCKKYHSQRRNARPSHWLFCKRNETCCEAQTAHIGRKNWVNTTQDLHNNKSFCITLWHVRDNSGAE